MSRPQTMFFTLLAMIAFAANSLLCRLALKHCGMDPATFTSLRIVSGALALALITALRRRSPFSSGSWASAFSLFAYAAGFSYAYVTLPAATGALLLFGAVQTTMIGYALWRGERFKVRQSAGVMAACSGVAVLMLPGVSAPPLAGSILMLGAGVAWGVYSLRGKGADDPTSVTAGNFLKGVPMALVLALFCHGSFSVGSFGFWYAISSGAVASGAGYALWYMALRGMKATSAATVQLSVPVLAAVGGIAFLGESVTLRLVIASAAILGGIAMVIVERQENLQAEEQSGMVEELCQSGTK